MRAAVAGFYVLGLIAGCSSWSCASSNTNQQLDPRVADRVRADADDTNQSLQKDEDKRDDQQSDAQQGDSPNRK
jgi:hypothetical protein